jgi:hypothetical protein
VNFFQWLGPWSGDEFVREITDEFRHNCKPEIARAGEPRDAEKRAAHATEVLANRAAKFHRQERLGWYRKARLLSAIKWQLLEAGYGDELVRSVLYAVLMKSAR